MRDIAINLDAVAKREGKNGNAELEGFLRAVAGKIRETAAEIELLLGLLRSARGILQYHKAVYPNEIDEALDVNVQSPRKPNLVLHDDDPPYILPPKRPRAGEKS